jgi:hypothetical protein
MRLLKVIPLELIFIVDVNDRLLLGILLMINFLALLGLNELIPRGGIL